MGNVAQVGFLRLKQIVDERTRRTDPAGHVVDPESFHCLHMKMIPQGHLTVFIGKIPFIKRRDQRMEPCLQVFHIKARHHECFIADDLGRSELVELIQKPVLPVRLRQHELPGRDIAGCDTEAVRRADDRHEVVVFAFLHLRGIKIRAGSHNPRDLPAHQSLCLLRVFHLIADSHFVTPFYEPSDICIHCVIRDAAHGRPLRKAAFLSRQGQFQFFGDGQRVIKEHLKEIPHPVHEDAVLICLFCFYIFLHHRR